MSVSLLSESGRACLPSLLPFGKYSVNVHCSGIMAVNKTKAYLHEADSGVLYGGVDLIGGNTYP